MPYDGLSGACTHVVVYDLRVLSYKHLNFPLQLQGEWSSQLASERHKLTQELFEVESRRRQTEEALQNALAADRKKAEDIRVMDSQHRAEVERLQRAARLSSKQQVGGHTHSC